ncbi:MAG: radical SAM protein [Nanoarchaeota archaeon]|nr:radical SAM protein [Nanoarchaeota archaeon]
MRKIKKIVIIELNSELPNLGLAMVMPRFGITVIGSILDKAGYDVKVYSESYTEVSLSKILKEKPDCIMLNGIKTAIPRIKEFAKKLKRKKKHILIIAGGEEATMFPKNIQEYVDYVVLHEGDETILKLLNTIKKGKGFSNINGIIYKKIGKCKRTGIPCRVKEISYRINPEIFVGLKDIGKKFIGRNFGLAHGWRVLSFPIQTTRGCIYNCAFCTQRILFGKLGYMLRDINDIIKDIDNIIEYSGITHFTVTDNLFGGNKKYTIKFLKRVVKHFKNKENKPRFSVLMRADQFWRKNFIYYNNLDLKLMKDAGIETISMGMESINEETLERINKKTNIRIYINAIKRLNKFNFLTTGTFGVGGGADTKKDIIGIIKFARIYNLKRIHIYVYTILPGTTEYRLHRNLVINNVPDKYYNGHAVCILPRKMLPSELQVESLRAMKKFNTLRSAEGIYYRLFFRKIAKSLKEHIKQLKKIEKDMIKKEIYIKNKDNKNWELNEDLLESFYIDYNRGVVKRKKIIVDGHIYCT